MGKKTYYEKVLEAFNKLSTVEVKKEFYTTIDFSKNIEKDSDAAIISELKKFVDLPWEKEKTADIIRNYFDKKDLAKQLLEVQPLFYDNSKIWWFWNSKEYRWMIIDETDVLNLVDKLSIANTIQAKEKSEILESLRQTSRKYKPEEIKPTWIQFKDKIYDINDGHSFKATPKYFVTNPVPYEVNGDPRTPIMDKIFEEWVGKEHVNTLYEILAYALLPDYPINRLFCLIGGGMNGKSCFLNLLRKFVGNINVCSTELDSLLGSRFEVTRLHKKLVCMMGETNFNEMNKTSIIKKLTGQDLIGFEYKNKDPFEETNYAKIIIATNNLPTTTDKTIGFYRRWLIIDFPNQFSESKDILADIPEKEYNSLATNCVFVLNKLLKSRSFTNEGSVENRMKRYEDKSNPLEKFWTDNVDEDYDRYIFKYEFSKILNQWCKENRFRELSDKAINKFMREKGIEEGRRNADWHNKEGNKPSLRTWEGLKFS